MQTFTCDTCSKAFQRSAYEAKQPHHFCSKTCYGAWRSQHLRGENNPRYSSQEVPCAHCGAILKRAPSILANQTNVFCSKQCKAAWQVENLKGANNPAWNGKTVEATCAFCGAALQRNGYRANRYGKHFCDTKCMGRWQSEHSRGENNPSYRAALITMPCAYCGKDIQNYRGNMKGHEFFFCNRECQAKWQAEYRVGDKVPAWKGGKQTYYGPNWNQQRYAARKRDHYACRCCGATAKEVGRKLDVHHIVPIKSFGYIPGANDHYKRANALSNLITLCPDCHKRAEHGSVYLLVQRNVK